MRYARVYSRRNVLFVFLGALVVTLSLQSAFGQCVEHPKGKTALIFSNESRHELTFFVDDELKTVLASGDKSEEFEVEPGEHLLRATAVLMGMNVSVQTVNPFPAGYVCTWTIENPKKAQQIQKRKRDFRNALKIETKHR
jgi:hypothetical protein